MTNVRFGIDIDGTVTSPTSLLPHINNAFKSNLQLDDIKEYDLTKAFTVSQEEFYDLVQKIRATYLRNFTYSSKCSCSIIRLEREIRTIFYLCSWRKCYGCHAKLV